MGLLSLPKLLILCAIIAAFWWGMRYQKRKADKIVKQEKPDEADNMAIDDMEQCPSCGIYFTAGLKNERKKNCDKTQCPYK